jgi:hypothetical protein
MTPLTNPSTDIAASATKPVPHPSTKSSTTHHPAPVAKPSEAPTEPPFEEVPEPPAPAPSAKTSEDDLNATITLAAYDVRMVLEEQREQSQILTTKLNILFVANGALLTSLSISRLMAIASIFSVAEVIGFLLSFILLVRAFLPRQVAVTPNLEDRKVLERYLSLSPQQYQLQMLVNLSETYNANKQRLDDVSQTLKYAAYATLSIAVVMLLQMLAVYVVP